MHRIGTINLHIFLAQLEHLRLKNDIAHSSYTL